MQEEPPDLFRRQPCFRAKEFYQLAGHVPGHVSRAVPEVVGLIAGVHARHSVEQDELRWLAQLRATLCRGLAGFRINAPPAHTPSPCKGLR
jgi:hypothetical protein